MNLELVESLIKDSAELLSKTAQLEEDLKKLPELEQKVASLAAQVVSTNKVAEDMKQRIRTRVEKTAARLVETGSLSPENVPTFLKMIEQDPSQVVDVLEKWADERTAVQAGSGSNEKVGGLDKPRDPFTEFCLTPPQ